jgi:hypothetical protein
LVIFCDLTQFSFGFLKLMLILELVYLHTTSAGKFNTTVETSRSIVRGF